MKDIPTLYEWIGGIDNLKKLTDTFYKKVLNDIILEPVFRNMNQEHSKHVSQFIAEVFKGPEFYTKESGKSHSEMIAHHLNKSLTEQQRKQWINLMIETADELKIPDDPEFRSAFVAYLEWGTRLAVINSNLTQNPIKEDEPMPKWGWGETGGPYQP